MFPAPSWDDIEKRLLQKAKKPGKHPWYSVVAILIAEPDEQVMGDLERHFERLDAASGEKWDLFFPGYGQAPGGTGPWVNNPDGRDSFVEETQRRTEVRIPRSGPQLLLLNVAFSGGQSLVVDYKSLLMGPMSEPARQTKTLGLDDVVENITKDHDSNLQQADYGVGPVVNRKHEISGDSVAYHLIIGLTSSAIFKVGEQVIGPFFQ